MSARWRTTCAALAALTAIAIALPAFAQDAGDRVEMVDTVSLIGEQHRLVIEVVTPPGATVEVDPGSPGWNDIQVIAVSPATVTPEGNSVRQRLELTIAPFRPGEQTFTPAVNIVDGAAIAPRTLPTVSWNVVSTLPPDAALEVSPLPPPAAIAGAEPPWLRPLIATGAALGVLIVGVIGWVVARRIARHPRPEERIPDDLLPTPSLAGAERLISHDPVSAYRQLAAIVRSYIARQYGFPAYALTTGELERRMESHGVDRWQARLVGGLLQECDSVVYAGYRPALERREADLTMAREIVGFE